MRALGFALLAALAGCSTPAPPSAIAPTTTTAAGPVAPSLDGATSWLNVDRPLDLASLEGRVVVVDFWTSGCINCIHTLATLKKLEAKYEGKPVVVIGIHSPKFDAEGETSRLASTLDAYDLHHPVAVDGKRTLWDRWGATAWPTVMVLDAHGHILSRAAGEPSLEKLSAAIDSALPGATARGPLPGLVNAKEDDSPLRFPGKVSALGDGRLAVTDTGHHRVVVLKSDGNVDSVIGNGLSGRIDGSFEGASFSAPEGTSYEDGILYIADTENHVVRAADLRAHTVTTIAGTGVIGKKPLGGEAEPATTVGLRSPWDVLAMHGQLYVALAGSHQIGVMDLKSGLIRRFAGSSREALTDGAPEAAAFAQPSGLASDGKSLFVADPESSAIRQIDLASGITKTLAGKGLFDFGDKDGNRDTARLQHAAGVGVRNGKLYIADTYNSKLKTLDLASGEVKTVSGGLFEPGGLTVDGDRVVIADTHHGRLVSDGKELPIKGLSAPKRGVAVAKAEGPTALDPKAPELRLGWELAAKGPTTVRIAWQLPAGTAINEEAPAALRWVAETGLARVPESQRLHGKEIATGVPIGLELTADQATLDGVLDVVTCDVATHAVCVPLRRNVRATITRGTADRLVASAALPAAR